MTARIEAETHPGGSGSVGSKIAILYEPPEIVDPARTSIGGVPTLVNTSRSNFVPRIT